MKREVFLTVGKLNIGQIKQFISKGLVYQSDKLPTITQILQFMEKYSGYTAQGYVLVPDYKVVITGINKGMRTDNQQEISEFMEMFSKADVVDVNLMFGQFNWEVK